MPRCTVIIPTHNRFLLLQQAVASVLRQSMQDIEILVVNDGAPLDFDFLEPKLRVLENQKAGAIAARNRGVAEAQSDYIAWLDDDDCWIDSDHLKHACDMIARGADFVFADGKFKFTDGRPAAGFTQPANAHSLAHDNTILVSSICYRRALHQKLGLFDAALPYYADWDWYLRVAQAGFQMQHHKCPVVEILVHADNDSGNANTARRRENLNLLVDKHNLGDIVLKNHTDFASF
jgi:glycosyltransferase involved in cell wall biosynthesis